MDEFIVQVNLVMNKINSLEENILMIILKLKKIELEIIRLFI